MKRKGVIALAVISVLLASAVMLSLTPKAKVVFIPYYTVDVRRHSFNVTHSTYYDVSFHLDSGCQVNFSFTVSWFLNVLLLDSENFESYRNGEPYPSILTIEATDTSMVYEGSYKAAKTDTYHLVFENSVLPIADSEVNLTVNRTVPSLLPITYY
nr:hypothetical protein [Candidatus Freyrarchaeum guaymaensis]